MAQLAAYRAIVESMQHSPQLKRYIQMLEAEPHDNARLSAIEEWRKLTVAILRATLSPEGQTGNLKVYREKLTHAALRADYDKQKLAFDKENK